MIIMVYKMVYGKLKIPYLDGDDPRRATTELLKEILTEHEGIMSGIPSLLIYKERSNDPAFLMMDYYEDRLHRKISQQEDRISKLVKQIELLHQIVPVNLYDIITSLSGVRHDYYEIDTEIQYLLESSFSASERYMGRINELKERIDECFGKLEDQIKTIYPLVYLQNSMNKGNFRYWLSQAEDHLRKYIQFDIVIDSGDKKLADIYSADGGKNIRCRLDSTDDLVVQMFTHLWIKLAERSGFLSVPIINSSPTEESIKASKIKRCLYKSDILHGSLLTLPVVHKATTGFGEPTADLINTVNHGPLTLKGYSMRLDLMIFQHLNNIIQINIEIERDESRRRMIESIKDRKLALKVRVFGDKVKFTPPPDTKAKVTSLGALAYMALNKKDVDRLHKETPYAPKYYKSELKIRF